MAAIRWCMISPLPLFAGFHWWVTHPKVHTATCSCLFSPQGRCLMWTSSHDDMLKPQSLKTIDSWYTKRGMMECKLWAEAFSKKKANYTLMWKCAFAFCHFGSVKFGQQKYTCSLWCVALLLNGNFTLKWKLFYQHTHKKRYFEERQITMNVHRVKSMSWCPITSIGQKLLKHFCTIILCSRRKKVIQVWNESFGN